MYANDTQDMYFHGKVYELCREHPQKCFSGWNPDAISRDAIPSNF